jgi:hypothetical protein
MVRWTQKEGEIKNKAKKTVKNFNKFLSYIEDSKGDIHGL